MSIDLIGMEGQKKNPLFYITELSFVEVENFLFVLMVWSVPSMNGLHFFVLGCFLSKSMALV